MDGFSFQMIETYQNLLSLPHVCRCMYPDFVYETNEVADRPAHRAVLSLKTLNILSARSGPKLSANIVSRRQSLKDSMMSKIKATAFCC